MKILLTPVLWLGVVCTTSILTACGGSSSGTGPQSSSNNSLNSVSAISSSSSAISSSLSVSSSSLSISSAVSSLSSVQSSVLNTSSSVSSASVSSSSIVASVQSSSALSSSLSSSASSLLSSSSSSLASSSSSSLNAIVVSTAAEVLTALNQAKAGDTIYIHGGLYQFNSTIALSADGTASNKITFAAYPGDGSRPLFDFSAMSENSANRGLALSGDYWHVKGIDVYRAGDNCMNISGSNNLVEHSTFFECADTGLQLGGGAANNTILNCDSYFNADSTLENADGFAAKLDVGTGNKFIGCRAWNNLDDGWDGYLRGADNITTTYENCWAFKNGYLKNGNLGAGDGNGFKTGGSDKNASGQKTLSHNAIYKNCIAVGNSADGFDHNSNRGEITLLNCSAYENGSNINFGTTFPAKKLTVKNSLSVGTRGSQNADVTDISNNSWQDGLTATDTDFISVGLSSADIALLSSARKADGSLPDIDYLHLTTTSPLIDKGVDVGLPFNGAAPDIGAFETSPD